MIAFRKIINYMCDVQCDTKLLIINLTWFKREYLNQFGTKTRHIKNKNKVLIRGKHQIHFIPFFTSLLSWIFNPKRLQPTLRHNAKPYYIIGTKVYVLQKKYISHHDSHLNYLLQPEKNWDRKAQEGCQSIISGKCGWGYWLAF